jgi:diguanylate cyclase (GGDEF)-like protein
VLLRILDVSRRMAERRAFAPLLAYIVDEVIKLTGAERGYVVLLRSDGSLDFRATRDQRGAEVERAQDQISTSVLKKVVETSEPLILRDAQVDPQFSAARSVMSLNLRSVMCVPLISYGKAIGAIYVENRSVRGRFKEENLVPLLLFANQSSVAIENAVQNDDLEARVAERTQALAETNAQLEQSRNELQQRLRELEVLHEQVHELSIRDSLTGLYNRRHLDQQMRQMFARSKRYQRPLAVAIGDIDNFKRVNDTLSHAAGDAILQTFGQILPEVMRSTDVIGRFGGEEFVFLLPETSIDEAVRACERIREHVESYDWSTIHSGLRVTMSIGVASDTTHEHIESQLRQADTLLYLAKQRGKNCVVAHQK